MEATPSGKTNVAFYVWLGLLVILILAGLFAWTLQLRQGSAVLGTGQTVVWGLYIAFFFSAIGAGAGALILAALPDTLGQERFRPLSKIAIALALVCFIGGGLTIVLDLGRPERVLTMLLSPNFSSPFVWDFLFLTACVVVAAVYGTFMLRGGLKESGRKALGWVAIVAAVGLVTVEGWILAVGNAHPLWHSPLLPLSFLVGGLLGGLALVALVAVVTRVAPSSVGELAGYLAAFIVVSAFLLLLEYVTLSYGGAPDVAEPLGALLGSPLFWVQLVLGVVVPFVMLVLRQVRASAVGLGVAAGLVLAGLVVEKLNWLVAGQSFPLYPVVSGAERGYYSASAVEWLVVVGVLALAALLYTLGAKFLPLTAEAKEAAA